jgi:GntR family transcriptional regulator
MSRLSQHPDDRLRREYERRRRDAGHANSPKPRHTYEQLRGAIRTGEIALDDLMVESELMKNYAATRNATRRALQTLAEDGLVNRERRVGTNVSASIVTFDVSRVLPAEEVQAPVAAQPDPRRFRIDELDFTLLAASAYLRDLLGESPEEVINLRQLVFLDTSPLFLRSGYAAAVPDYRGRVEDTNQNALPLEVAFETLFDVAYGGSEITIQAIAADPDTARELQLETGAPILVRQLLLRDVEGVARELSFTYFRADRVSLMESTTF